MAHFEIRDLTFSYAVSPDKASLHNISLTIERGSYTVICGRSGSGKTTLLRHLKPVLTPNGKQSGEILFCGREVTGLSDRDQAHPDRQPADWQQRRDLACQPPGLVLNSCKICCQTSASRTGMYIHACDLTYISKHMRAPSKSQLRASEEGSQPSKIMPQAWRICETVTAWASVATKSLTENTAYMPAESSREEKPSAVPVQSVTHPKKYGISPVTGSGDCHTPTSP